jgi:PAS domain S-box-containing protein
LDEDAREQIRNTGVHRPYEKEFFRKDGSRVWGLFSAVAWEDNRNEGVSFIVDITERKRAEEELQRSKERLELAVEVASLGEWEVNLVDLSASHSERHAHIFGYEMPSGEWSLQKFCDHVLPEHREDLKRHLENCLSGGKLDFEVPIRRVDGEVRWIWVRGRTWPDKGKPTRMFGTVMDITERKRVEQAMIQSEKLASVGRMASSIAHEINNPLEIIGNAVFLAITNTGIPEEAKSYLRLATQELDRVTHITRQTLAFHRSEKKPVPVDLRECTEDLLKLFVPRLNSRGIVVETRYSGVRPILANSGEVQQVISNLLANSMDAILNHGVIRIRVSPSIGLNGSSGVRFTIADNGVGIPPDRLKRIFEAFFTTKEMVGTGLGLWVSKQILEKYGATIEVRSKLGSGTVISIVFPPGQEGTQA